MARRSFFGFLRDRTGGAHPLDVPDDSSLGTLDHLSAQELTASLGLVEGSVQAPPPEPGVHRPTVLVMGCSPKRLSWLAAAVPDVTLVRASTVDEAMPLVEDAEAIVGWWTPGMVAAARRLRWVHYQSAGVDQIVADTALRDRGILLTSMKRTAGPVMAQHVFAMVLSLTRRLPEFLDDQRRRDWSQARVQADRLGFLGRQTLLVVGLGGTGAEVARLGGAFGMRVLAVRAGGGIPPDGVERVGRPEDLVALCGEADVIVCAVPLTATTRGLFDRRVFQATRRGAMFVNVGRGASVVTSDLVEALESGQLSGAALDTVDPEPLPRGHVLWTMPRVLITPHVSGWSSASTERGWLLVRENLRRFTGGAPLFSVVDLASGY